MSIRYSQTYVRFENCKLTQGMPWRNQRGGEQYGNCNHDRSRCSRAIHWVQVGYFIRKSLAEAKISSAEQAAVQIVENAKKEAEALKKETVLEAKDEIHRIRAEAEKDTRERRNEIQRQERRLLQKKSRWIKNWNH